MHINRAQLQIHAAGANQPDWLQMIQETSSTSKLRSSVYVLGGATLQHFLWVCAEAETDNIERHFRETLQKQEMSKVLGD